MFDCLWPRIEQTMTGQCPEQWTQILFLTSISEPHEVYWITDNTLEMWFRKKAFKHVLVISGLKPGGADVNKHENAEYGRTRLKEFTGWKCCFEAVNFFSVGFTCLYRIQFASLQLWSKETRTPILWIECLKKNPWCVYLWTNGKLCHQRMHARNEWFLKSRRSLRIDRGGNCC